MLCVTVVIIFISLQNEIDLVLFILQANCTCGENCFRIADSVDGPKTGPLTKYTVTSALNYS